MALIVTTTPMVRIVPIIRHHITHHIHLITRLIIRAMAIRIIHTPHIAIRVMGIIIMVTVTTTAITIIVIVMTILAPHIHTRHLIRRVEGVAGEGGGKFIHNLPIDTTI